MDLQAINRTFEREFAPVVDKFSVLELSGDTAATPDNPLVDRPGVYVYWKGDRVLRVGRSFSNARKRALEHIRDNTGGLMSALRGDAEVRLVLFTVSQKDYHWVAALEVYLEDQLDPAIPCKRRG